LRRFVSYEGTEPVLCGETADSALGGSSNKNKRRRINYGQASPSTPASIQTVPSEVLCLVLQFINTPSSWGRSSLVCRQWRQVALSKPVAESLRLWDNRTGEGAVQLGTEASNLSRLEYFAAKNNVDAMYLLGVMLSYTGSFAEGVKWFDKGASLGDVRCIYGKGIVVRDGDRVEGERCLRLASTMSYYPAQLELPPAVKERKQLPSPPLDELKEHMIPRCLLRYLRRWFVEDGMARGKRTSHCWNAECGRWAEKTTVNAEENNTSPNPPNTYGPDFKLSRMKMCSSCRRAKYCSKLCQVYDWRVGRHRAECGILS